MSSCCKRLKNGLRTLVYRIKTFIFHLVVPGEGKKRLLKYQLTSLLSAVYLFLDIFLLFELYKKDDTVYMWAMVANYAIPGVLGRCYKVLPGSFSSSD